MKIRNCLFFFVLMAIPFFALAQPGQDPVNQTDSKGLKQGKWLKHHKNGKKRYEGTFKNDLPIGKFTYYNEKGQVHCTMVYAEPGGNANSVFFHENGKKMGEGMYVNKKKEGEWVYYDDRGTLSGRESYVKGVRQGMAYSYFLNGTTASEINYVDGLKQGPSKEYFKDGGLKLECTYLDDNFDGKVTWYFANDGNTKKTEGQYTDAVKDGKWIYYLQNGSIEAIELYEVGKLVKQSLPQKKEKE